MAETGNKQHVQSPSSIDGLLDRLKARVDERNATGQYPTDLIERLDEHFKRMVHHHVAYDRDELTKRLEILDDSSHFTRARIKLDSTVPVGNQVHRVINKVVSRQTDGVLQQMQQFSDDVRVLLELLVQAVHDGSTHQHTDLLTRIDSVIERLDSYERKPLDDQAALGDLRRRIEKLEQAEEKRDFNPWFTNDAFENAFRGDPEELRTRYMDLVGVFGNVPEGPIVDLGSGRGEFLELIKTLNRECWGIEIDPALAEISREKGFETKVGDGVAILRSVPDESLSGISLIQVIEHLSRQQQLDLVDTAYRKLKKGGALLIETVNPRSLNVFAQAFYIDPTHSQPVHPQYVEFLMREKGFSTMQTLYRSFPPEEARLESAGDPAEKRNFEKLNELLFAAGDYATCAYK